MIARRLGALLCAATLLTLAGCGQSSGGTPDVGKLPLPPGAQISLRVERCDKGANAFCAWELVVTSSRARNSEELFKAQHALLLKSGWTGANADTGEQHAADSPGHKLRVTYATAFGDLKGIDLGWIKRSRKVTLALSRALFAHTAAMSMLLESGAG
jgi:predicted small lipoprotein YifL